MRKKAQFPEVEKPFNDHGKDSAGQPPLIDPCARMTPVVLSRKIFFDPSHVPSWGLSQNRGRHSGGDEPAGEFPRRVRISPCR